MDNSSRWLIAILLFAVLCGLACSQQTTTETQSTQSPAEPSASSADTSPPKQDSAKGPALLAKRDQIVTEAKRLYADGKLAETIAKCEEGLVLDRRLYGEESDAVANTLGFLGKCHGFAGNFAAARQALEEVLQIRTSRLGEEHWQVGDARRELADVELRSKFTPEQNRRLTEAIAANDRAVDFNRQGSYIEAIKLAREAVGTIKELFGENHPVYAGSLHNFANFYFSQKDYEPALPLFEQALAIRKHALGDKHPHTAETLGSLGAVYLSQGNYSKALPLLEQVVGIFKEVVGEKHPDTATALNNLAALHQDQGEYTRALPLSEKALAIDKEVLGEKHPVYAVDLNNLGSLFLEKGDYARALVLLKESLSIRKQAFGEKHPDTATARHNLAALYDAQGDYAQALPLYEQALTIRKELLGELNPDFASSLNNLALLYHSQGDDVRALSFYERALAIRKQVLGEDHPHTGQSLNNLAGFHELKGDYARARSLYEQALKHRREFLGETHPEFAVSLNNLAGVYRLPDDFARALPLYEQALAIRKEMLGENHPHTAQSLRNLAIAHESMGDFAKALPLFQNAVLVSNSNLELSAAVQSERQQLLHNRLNYLFISSFISCALSADEDDAAYEQLLVSKGAVLRRQRLMRLWREVDDPDARSHWDNLQSVTTRLSTLALKAPKPDQVDEWRQQLSELTNEKERLEAELSQRRAEFRKMQAQVKLTPNQLMDILPPRTALIDMLEFSRWFDEKPKQGPARRRSEKRLAAFIVHAGSPVVAIDLGPTEPINVAVAQWRDKLRDTQSAENDEAGREVRRLAWEPLAPHLEGAKTVLVSPDGALAQIPWGALPGSEPGSYLLEERAIGVVPVPQLIPDVLGDAGIVVAPSLCVVGDVDYGANPGKPLQLADTRSAPRGDGSRNGVPESWPPLLATQPEIADIESSFRGAFESAKVTELAAAGATEEAFRQLAGKHRFLHVATHGFFAKPEIRSALAADITRDGALNQTDLFGERGVIGFHPGLLSGIVLAGANLPPEPERDDGILTALEVGALDLRNVDLVTLSACETGLGQVAGGEGILGLQRAFQIAGARTTLTSLWKVNDDATRALMSEFYKNLWQKKLPRIEALRQAQLAMLNGYDKKSRTLRGPGGIVAIDPDELESTAAASKNEPRIVLSEKLDPRTPPAYWAAFVLSGDWQ